MSQQKPVTPPPSLNLQDILYVLFKHKGKIILSAAIGIAAAAFLYSHQKPVYVSEAKLMVRYVVDRSAVDTLDSQPQKPGSYDGVTNSEVQILTSWDLAEQVAQAIGVERLAPGGGKAAAAYSIHSGLAAEVPAGGNVIVVSYKNADPDLAVRVLQELVSRYFVKHLEVHRSADAFNFVTQQTDQVRARLNGTEEELKRLKGLAGIASLSESKAILDTELPKVHEALRMAEADRAEQQARIEEMEKSSPAAGTNPEATPSGTPTKGPSAAEIQQYQGLVTRLDGLRQIEMELVSKYIQIPDHPEPARQIQNAYQKQTSAVADHGSIKFSGSERSDAVEIARERYRRQNDTGFGYQSGKKNFDTLVKEAEQDLLRQKSDRVQEEKASENLPIKLNRVQIANLEKQRQDLESKYPGIASMAVAGSVAAASAQNHELDLLAERVRLAGTEARTKAHRSRLHDLQKRASHISEFAPQIAELERTREIEENNYKYFQASLEKARIDEALDPAKIPNISAVQKPSPAVRATSGLKKKVLGLAGGGVAFGVALAFFIELILNRTVKRSGELETLLGIPFVLSIPKIGRRHSHPRLSRSGQKLLSSAKKNGHSSAPPWESGHFIRPFSEAIRDRLVLFFELNQMNHKPKLVAVTGCSHGAGTSTISAGLAAALSETGDGKVLLVDMNVGHPELHPFFRGTPACSLAEALVGEPAPAGENLYLAVAAPHDGWQGQLIPKKFYNLMPHLKASEFDYIIFDMPPLDQTSATIPMAGLMDKVLVVVEAQKSNRDFVKRMYAELLACRANASVVFNRARSYIPKCLGVEG